MKLTRSSFVAALLGALLILLSTVAAHAQTAQKAIVLGWDGTVPAFVQEMLSAGKLPNLAKLIAGGALANDVVPSYPSKTAPGFAALMTGAPPRITGISGNRVPRAPQDQFTILESLAGFAEAPLRAEPIWATAQRADKKAVIAHIPSFAGEMADRTVRLAGYNLIAGRDGIVTKRAIQTDPPNAWLHAPASNAPPIEIAFTIGESQLFGLLIDDPADAQLGYDTLVIGASRDGAALKASLKPAPANVGGELFWSAPLTVPLSIKSTGGQEAKSYLRLFDLKADGSDFFLYYSRPARAIELDADADASPTVRAFIGNGASILYQNGALGRTLANGGSGGAEARYVETMLMAQHQLMETNRWAMEHNPWDLFLAYTPFPDEAEHAWRGHLDPTLPTFRQEIADKLRPLLEQVYRSCDDHLGQLLAKRAENTLVALISDHGIQGIYKRVALNQALQQAGLLAVDAQGRVDLARTKIIYPAVNNGYLMINSAQRKSGIVKREDRADLVRKVREVLLALRDGERQIVAAIIDADVEGEAKGIGGETGGDLYIELAPGYDFDPRVGSGPLISAAEPYGTHGANPQLASMRTLMVLNGPGIRAGAKLTNVRIIDFAPTLSWLLNLPKPKDATGRVLYEAFTEPR
jgi:predicted AlkP superfamily phosphohydrolase/phosphomutase